MSSSIPSSALGSSFGESPIVDSSSDEEFDIDQSILKHVKAAVGRVASFQNGGIYQSDEEQDLDENPLPNDSMSIQKQTVSCSDLLDQRILELREQVALLQAEIGQLETGSQERRDGGEGGGGVLAEGVTQGVLEKKMDRLIDSAAGGFDSDRSSIRNKEDFLSRLCAGAGAEETETVKDLCSQIKLNEAVSGIKMDSVDWEVVRKNDSELFQEHRHVGSIEGYSFCVTFTARENLEDCRSDVNGGFSERSRDREVLSCTGKMSCTGKIISLRPEVDNRAKKELKDFLIRVSADCDLLGFYQMYSSYCLSCRSRRETRSTLQSTLSHCVSLSDGVDGIRLTYQDSNGVVMNFTWEVLVPVYGLTVEERIAIQTKTPSTMSSELLEQVLSIPPHLKDLVNKHGVRKGLLNLFKSLEPAASWHDI